MVAYRFLALLFAVGCFVVGLFVMPLARHADRVTASPPSIGSVLAVAGLVTLLSVPALLLAASWPHLVRGRRGTANRRGDTIAGWVVVTSGLWSLAWLTFGAIAWAQLGPARLGATVVTGSVVLGCAVFICAEGSLPRLHPLARLLGAVLVVCVGTATGIVLR